MLPKYYDGDKEIAKFIVDAIYSDKFKKSFAESGFWKEITELLKDVALTVELYSFFDVWPSEEIRSFCFVIKDAYEKNYGHDDVWKMYLKE